MTKATRKRIAQLEAALRHIARSSSGYTSESAMGCIHACANDVLVGYVTMTAVRVRHGEGLESADYNTVYSNCPAQFNDRAHADDWAHRLNVSGSWPKDKNPGYRVVEITSNEGIDPLTGHPTDMSLST
jgi:hypothetical protein